MLQAGGIPSFRWSRRPSTPAANFGWPGSFCRDTAQVIRRLGTASRMEEPASTAAIPSTASQAST